MLIACALLQSTLCGCTGTGKDSAEVCADDTTVYVSIVAGTDGVCGLDSAGWATCWGAAAVGAVLDEPFIVLDVEAKLVCGVTQSGTGVCWGADAPGQTPPDGSFVDVAVTEGEACWTDALGVATCVGDPCSGDTDECIPSPPEAPTSNVAGGRNIFCGLDSSSSLSCWGASWTWQAAPSAAASAVDAGGYNVCVVERVSGDIRCTNVLGGGESGEPVYGPGVVAIGPGPWISLTAGDGFACALDGAGQLTCSLGMYDSPDQAVSVPSGPFTAIAAGSASAPGGVMLCAAPESGGIYCWTWLDYADGQIGSACEAPWEQEPA